MALLVLKGPIGTYMNNIMRSRGCDIKPLCDALSDHIASPNECTRNLLNNPKIVPYHTLHIVTDDLQQTSRKTNFVHGSQLMWHQALCNAVMYNMFPNEAYYDKFYRPTVIVPETVESAQLHMLTGRMLSVSIGSAYINSLYGANVMRGNTPRRAAELTISMFITHCREITRAMHAN